MNIFQTRSPSGEFLCTLYSVHNPNSLIINPTKVKLQKTITIDVNPPCTSVVKNTDIPGYGYAKFGASRI